MTTIDVHAHIFPDQVALNAVPVMAKEAGIKEAIDGRLTSLSDSMDHAGIGISWIQPVATNPIQVDKINSWMESVRSERIIPFGAMHPDYSDLPGLIRDLSRRGFPGIKIHPEYQSLQPNDPNLFPMYEAVIEENMIILYHAGVDIGIPSINSTPKHFVRLIDTYPDLSLILAHMGGFQQWDDVLKHLCTLAARR